MDFFSESNGFYGSVRVTYVMNLGDAVVLGFTGFRLRARIPATHQEENSRASSSPRPMRSDITCPSTFRTSWTFCRGGKLGNGLASSPFTTLSARFATSATQI